MYKVLNKREVSERTGKNTVAIIGFGQIAPNSIPWDDEKTEFWSLNGGFAFDWIKRKDRWFQMHTIEYLSQPRFEGNIEFLSEKQDFPIYMQEEFDFVPSAVRYPIEIITQKFGKYFTSSLTLMMALALLEGFERIELYGFDVTFDGDYAYQRAGAEYMIGLARGMGCEVILPLENTMCKAEMYGYETDRMIFRNQLERERFLVHSELLEKHQEMIIENSKKDMLDLLRNGADLVQVRTEQDACITKIQQDFDALVKHLKDIDKQLRVYEKEEHEKLAKMSSNL